MSLLNMDLELFEFETVLDELEGEHSGTCSECGFDLGLDEHTGRCSKCDSAIELNEVEKDLDESEWEEEIKRGKRSFRRPSGRRSRPARRHSPRVRNRSPTKLLRPSGALRPKLKRRRHKSGKRPIVIRPKRRRQLVIREPAAPCVCPAHGTEFVRWVQSSLNQISGLRLRVNGVMNRATRDALREFQKSAELPIDGVAGPETERALVEAKKRLSGSSDSYSSELDGLDALKLNLVNIGSEKVGNADLVDFDFMEDHEKSENKVFCPDCPSPCHPFPPPKRHGGWYQLRNRCWWFTPVYQQYPTNLWGLAELIQTRMLESNNFTLATVPDQKDIRYAIKAHLCNKHFKKSKPMFMPRFGPDRCTGRGTYYGSIYIPFKWS